MKNFFFPLLIVLCLLFNGCLKLDSNLYNPDNSITEYRLDAYEGDVRFTLNDTYKIPDSLIHIFTLDSYDDQTVAKIYAIYIGSLSRISTDTVIMYCHGNASHMDTYWQRAKLLANVGGKNRFGVLMIDYRGYGLSEGTPSEEGLYADVDAGLDWLKSRGLTPERLIMYGFSLGSAPATELSAFPRTLKPSKLILEAPFASSRVMIEDGTGLALPASFLTDTYVDNAAKIVSVSQPFLWLHGEADHFLSMKTHGQVVYDRYTGSYKAQYIVPDADHSEVPQGHDPLTQQAKLDTYSQKVLDFILR